MPDLPSTGKRIEPSVSSPTAQVLKRESALAEAEGLPYGALAVLKSQVVNSRRGEPKTREPGRSG